MKSTDSEPQLARKGGGEEMYKRGQGFAKGTARNKSSQCSERWDSPLNTSAQNTRQGCPNLCTFEEKYSLNRKCHSRPMQGKVYSKVTCCDVAFIPWSKAVMFSPNRVQRLAAVVNKTDIPEM